MAGSVSLSLKGVKHCTWIRPSGIKLGLERDNLPTVQVLDTAGTAAKAGCLATRVTTAIRILLYRRGARSNGGTIIAWVYTGR